MRNSGKKIIRYVSEGSDYGVPSTNVVDDIYAKRGRESQDLPRFRLRLHHGEEEGKAERL